MFTRHHTLALLAGLLLAPLTALPQAPTNCVLSVRADRPDAAYKQGETVTFTIALSLDNQPVKDAVVNWVISKDGAPPLTSGTMKLTGPSTTVAVGKKLDEPGFRQCCATFAASNEPVRTALGGVAVDPLLIKPSLPTPADFDEFWAAQKAKLAAIPANARLSPEKSPASGVDCFDVSADCDGPPVSGYLARPTGARPKSLPIILTLHGVGVRSSDLGSAASWARQGFLAMDMNANGLPNGQPKEFYSDLANQQLKDYFHQGRDSRDTVYFRGMFLRLIRAIDFLTAQPEWDGHTVIVHGSSQGGWQAIAAAGLDSRVTFFAAGVPAGCDLTGVVANRANGWPQFFAKPPAKPDPKILEAVRYYDCVNFATRAKAAGILTVGFIDTSCPPTGVYAAYNALSGPKRIFNDIPSGHALSPQATAAMRAAILDHAGALRPVPFQYSEGQTAPRSEVRDPCIVREGDTYYLTFTMYPFRNREEKYFQEPNQGGSPGITLYSSQNLKDWKFEKWLVKSADLPEDCPYKNRFWAPEIHKINGKFYLIFTADNWLKNEYNPAGKWGSSGYAFVGVSDTITGPYEHVTWLKGAGCDTTLFQDDDGKTYALMPFSNQYIQEVDLSGIERGDIRLIGERKMVMARDNSDVGKKTIPRHLEGPWMIKRNGKYVLFSAASYGRKKEDYSEPMDLDPGYWVATAVANNIWGPYTKQAQTLQKGHAAVFTGPDGEPWLSYRGEEAGKASHGRLCIDPITFNEDRSVRPERPSDPADKLQPTPAK